MLSIKNLTVEVNNKLVLNDFNMEIYDKDIVALMGQNGAGKSTICKVIMGHPSYKVVNGSIIYNGIDLLSKTPDERSRAGIYLVSQNPIEIEGLSNADMLRASIEAHRNKKIDFLTFDKEIRSVCKQLNISESFIHRGINEGMSGGEKKKNEILHLYMIKPKLILLDELDSGLDIDSLKFIANSIKEYMKDDTSLLIVTHHTSILEILNPNKVIVLSNGSIIKEGDYSLAKRIEDNGFRALEVSESE